MGNERVEEMKARIRSEYPQLARIIDSAEERTAAVQWDIACLAFDFGFGCGITYGLEQSAKITGFVMDRLLK